MKEQKIKILVLGQTPPPFLGQAMMIDRLVRGKYERIRIVHVRMAFSDNLREIGKFGFGKIAHLIFLIYRTIYLRFREGVHILYYPPSGPHRNPLLRDLIILFFVRPFFRKTIFHFRAAGVSQLLDRSPRVLRLIGKRIYNRPDGVVQQSQLNPADGKYFHAKKIFIIKNGLEDSAIPYLPIERAISDRVQILFVGAMYYERGIFVILDALKILKEAGIAFHFTGVGDFVSPEFEASVVIRCREYGLVDDVTFPGPKVGDEKWKEYVRADVFCFPSFVESESFGNVVAEAMMFELPVIATRWNALPDVVTDSETGYLIPVRNPSELAEKFRLLALDSQTRIRMGKAGRQKFLRHFQLSSHLENMEDMFVEVATSDEKEPPAKGASLS